MNDNTPPPKPEDVQTMMLVNVATGLFTFTVLIYADVFDYVHIYLSHAIMWALLSMAVANLIGASMGARAAPAKADETRQAAPQLRPPVDEG